VLLRHREGVELKKFGRLVVVAEVSVSGSPVLSRNRSFNEIITEYCKYFDDVHLIAPGKKELIRHPGWADNLYVSTIVSYEKNPIARLAYFTKIRKNQKKLKALIDKFSPNVIQLRIPSLFTMTAYRAARELGVPVSTYVGGDWYTSFTNNYKFPGATLLARMLERWQEPILRGSIIVTAGPVLAKKYKALGECYAYYSTTHRIVYENLSEKSANLIYVGRLEPLKRVEDAIFAVDIIRKTIPHVHLEIVGDGVERKKIEKLVLDLKLEKNITLKGQIKKEEDLRGAYRSAAILLFPSISEGTPKVIAEAMAHGVVPVAVKEIGSIPFIIEDGVRGLLVSPKAPTELAEAVLTLLQNSDMLESMRKQGFDYARQHTLCNEVESLWAHVTNRIGISG